MSLGLQRERKDKSSYFRKRPPSGRGPERIRTYGIVFLSSFSLLVSEVVAGRALAPYVGVSLYTWTSIIGVVLAGISVGAYLGGVIADRYPRFSTLGAVLFLSGLGTISVSPVINWIGGTSFHTILMVRILLITAIVFFIPSCLLGMISPLVVRLAVRDLKKAGNMVGKIYAFSALGSIVGAFATGLFLISWMGTRTLLFATGLVLLIAGFLIGDFSKWRKAVGAVVFLLPFLWLSHRSSFKPALAEGTFFFKESNYYTIRLRGNFENDKDRLITLYLDNLSHSCSDPDNPLRLEFRYIRSYKEIVQWRAEGKESFRALFIGGGGYTFPRFIEARYPGAQIEVIEIDPEVTRVSRRYMGISPASRIQTFNADGRWFLMNQKGEGKYDFIFEDAFNDLSIPYHLTTREFAVELRRLLKKDGLLLTNVIDRFEKGSFLPSYIRTLEEVFGKGNVHLIMLGRFQETGGVGNRIVVTGPRKVDIDDLTRTLNGIGEDERISHVLPQGRLQYYLDSFSPVILTDDYVPVDNLTAANFE